LFGRPRELRTRHSMADNIGGLKDNAIVPVPPFLSSVPSRFSLLVEPLRRRQNLEFAGDGEMRFTQRTAETETEKLERQQREREAMRQAIAAYTGPITKCPPGKTTWSWLRSGKRSPGWRIRKANGR
jgi:hypothetical protein